MNYGYTFGKEKTFVNENELKNVLSKLSEEAIELLSFVASKLEEQELLTKKTNDPRGVYIESDNFQCKPFSTKVVEEILNSKLVNSHPDSVEGVYFLSMNSDVAWAMVEVGKFEFLDLRP